ncbi:MAG: hypothetical protein HUJ51_06745 [Eggerthellaceae bacterium]|nr:hypothetical protein [Eggerthellaceae bacterium]
MHWRWYCYARWYSYVYAGFLEEKRPFPFGAWCIDVLVGLLFSATLGSLIVDDLPFKFIFSNGHSACSDFFISKFFINSKCVPQDLGAKPHVISLANACYW